MSIVAIVVAVGAVSLSQPAGSSQPSTPSAAAPATAGPYHVLTTFNVGGDGAWDYLCLDAEGKRLFVPRSTHTMILDTQSGKVLGDIPDTAGVHGVAAPRPDQGKGFTSNGRAASVTVFDLTEYKTLSTVKVGDNPDSILFEPTTKRVFTFNGKSKDSTVIERRKTSRSQGRFPSAASPSSASPTGPARSSSTWKTPASSSASTPRR